MGTLVIATSNLGKLDEFKEMFKELPVELKCLADYPPLPPPNENGRTFAANAKIKAAYYAKNLKEFCLADDSGLEVKALDGAPACAVRVLPATTRRTSRTMICFCNR